MRVRPSTISDDPEHNAREDARARTHSAYKRGKYCYSLSVSTQEYYYASTEKQRCGYMRKQNFGVLRRKYEFINRYTNVPF